jgi:hypothetical protein
LAPLYAVNAEGSTPPFTVFLVDGFLLRYATRSRWAGSPPDLVSEGAEMPRTGDHIENVRTGQRVTFQITAEDSDRALVRLDSYNRPGPFEPVHVHPEQESNVEVLPRPCEFRHRKTDSVTTVTPTRILALGCALRTGAFAHGDFA